MIIEKPIADTVENARKIIDLLQNNIPQKKEVLLFPSSLPIQQLFK
jgi:hypothetical protein